MFRINSSAVSGFTGNFIPKSIQSRRWIALLASIAANFFLIYLLDTSPFLIREPKQAAPFSNKVVNISFVVPKTAPNTPPADSDRKDEILKPSSDQVLRTESRPDLTSQTDEELLPPKPYYFQPGELSEKTRGSLDIPPELSAILAGKVPRSAKLRLQINEYGEVDQVIVDESSFSETEQQLLVDMFQKKKFEAGKIDNQPVKSEISLGIVVEK